jgi:sigma-B regulation protein RsbU (phosphoserine phosphatase)
MIGAFTGVQYVNDEVVLDKGDILVLYTDGVTEARCNGAFFGDDRLANYVKELTPESVGDIPQLIFDEITRCTGGKLSDDIALLVISNGAYSSKNSFEPM